MASTIDSNILELYIGGDIPDDVQNVMGIDGQVAFRARFPSLGRICPVLFSESCTLSDSRHGGADPIKQNVIHAIPNACRLPIQQLNPARNS